jgi:hypothetical protein
MNTPNSILITSSVMLSAALSEIFARCDFAEIGQVKDHFEKVEVDGEKVKTDKVNGSFLTAQVRMPKGSAIMIGGDNYYPTTFAVKVDAFHLEGAKPEGGPATPKAATLSNAEILRAKLGRKAPDANGTTEIVAVNPEK